MRWIVHRDTPRSSAAFAIEKCWGSAMVLPPAVAAWLAHAHIKKSP
jgi:hypothetical protein